MNKIVEYGSLVEWYSQTASFADRLREKLDWKLGVLVACVGAACVARRYNRGAQFTCSSDKRMTDKTVLVTGSTSGEGLIVAVEFAKMNARVIITGDDQRELDTIVDSIRLNHTELGTLVTYGTLDLLDQVSVLRFASVVSRTEPLLHVLVNQAAVYNEEPVPSLEGYERQMCVNHLGHVLLTDLLMPNLRVTSGARVVFRTTGALEQAEFDLQNMSCEHFYDARLSYCNSQLANAVYARILASKEVRVRVHVAQTESSRMERFRRLKWPCYYMRVFAAPLHWAVSNGARDRVQTILYAGVHEDLATGGYYRECAPVEWGPKLDELCESLGESLYVTSRKMVNRNNTIFGIFSNFDMGYTNK